MWMRMATRPLPLMLNYPNTIASKYMGRLSSALTVAGILITLPPLSARKRRKPPFLFLFLRMEGEELERCPQPRVQNKVDHCTYKTSAKCWDLQTLLWNRFGDKIHTVWTYSSLESHATTFNRAQLKGGPQVWWILFLLLLTISAKLCL